VLKLASYEDAIASDPDSDILPSLMSGDQRSFNMLVDRHVRALSAQASQMLGDAHAAEDITQTVFLKTWQMLPDWQTGNAKLISWMRKVSTNLCLDYLRKHKPIYTDNVPDIASTAIEADARIERKEAKHRILSCIESLPERQRAALTLFYYQELSLKESAEIMEISPSAFESLLRRGRSSLKFQLSRKVRSS